MAEIKLRLNLDKEEVELVVDGEVALTSGNDVFKNWVDAYNEKHKTIETPVEEKVVVVEPVEEKEPLESPTVELDTDDKE